jgi:hypothetical protein
MKKKVETESVSEQYKCEHCGRSFIRPNTMLRHLCESKRRWDERDRPANRIAYSAWLKFYERFQPSKKRREYRDFIASAYYGGFIKFGSYCADVGVINPINYANWLLDNNSALDNWTSDQLYTRYLVEHLRSEDAMDAVHRSVANMLKLAEKENLQLGDVFKFANSNKICHLIISGKISPWVLYQSASGTEFLTRLNADNRGLIYDYIDPERWQIKFLRESDNVKQVVNVLEQIAGL